MSLKYHVPYSMHFRLLLANEYFAVERKIPIVFRWDSGGNEVYICGSFNNWESKIPMTNRFVGVGMPPIAVIASCEVVSWQE